MKKLALSLASVVALSACGGDDERPVGSLAPVSSDARFVVRHTDFASSAYSFLDAEGNVVADAWIHSGSTPPGLTAVLSGDTDLPTRMEPGILTIIDRFAVDVVTRIDLSTGDVLGQVRTQGSSDSAFSSNPNDVAYVSATSAWVTRYGHNTMAGVDPDVQGSDLLELDPSTMTRTGARVDLSSFETVISVYSMGAMVDKPARARPSRVIQVGGFLVVGLDLITDVFEGAAPGKLAIVNIATKAVSSYDLGGLTNCGGLSFVPGNANHIAITCKGYIDPVAEAGVLIVNVDGTTGAVTPVSDYLFSDYPSASGVFDSVLVLDDDEFLGVHNGGYRATDPPDELFHVHMQDGSRSKLHTAAHASDLFVTMAYDPASGVILVPEKTVGIRRMRRDAVTGVVHGDGIITLDGHGLPAAAVVLLP